MEIINVNGASSAWIDKHRPKKISEVVGNNKALHSICAWLNEFNTNKKMMLKKIKKNNMGKKNRSKSKKKLIEIPELIKNLDNIDENIYDNINDDEKIEEDIIDIEYIDENDIEISKKKAKKRDGPFSCLLVTGNHGVGKTCSIYATLSDLGYEIQTINFTRIQKLDNIKDTIDRLTNTTDVISMIENREKKKSALVVDEVESLMSKPEISCIAALIESNDMKWHYPIIFISNNQHNKFINEIKKKSYEIKMWQPYPETMQILLNRIKEKENIKFQNNQVVNKIIDHSQKDFRRLVSILQDIKYIYEDKLITTNIIDEYCELSKRKDIDYDLFTASSNIICKYGGIDEILRYHETDKVNLPLMMQENYIKGINEYCGDSDIKYELMKNITDSLSKGDVIENYIYGNQNWSIHEVHGFYACVHPSYLMDNNLDTSEKYSKYNGDNNINRNFMLKFPSDLNRTSIKKINKKNILKVNEFLKNMNIKDYVYINQLIRNLIEDDKIEECTKLFQGYNFNLDNIDKLLKVDKIKSTKINLTSKQKKEITKNFIKLNNII